MKFTHMLCQYILWNKMMLDPLELELQMVKRFLFFFFNFIYEYTVAVFRHTRRGREISLQMVVIHHVVAGN